MALGLMGIQGIFAGIDGMDLLSFVYVSFFGTYVLYPI